ncbi:carbonic anhydrase [Thiovibrio sp. JS02]
MRPKIPLLTLLILVSLIGATEARMLPVRKVRAGIPPYSVADNMVRHNDQVVSRDGAGGEAKEAITPHLIWLADCDARVQSSLFYPDPEKRVYSVRNIANQLSLSLGAIDYGVNILLSPVLLITGNTDSDSLRLFTNGHRDLDQDLRRDLDPLRLPLGEKPVLGAGTKGDAPLVEKNIDYQVTEAVKRYRQRIASGRLVVIGAVLDLDNQYGLGENRLIIININGETDAEKLRAMSHLTRLDKRLLEMVGRRTAREKTAAEKPAATPVIKSPVTKKKK